MKKVSLVISLTRINWFKDDFLFGTARVLEGPSDVTNRTIHIKGSFPVHDIGTCYECFSILGVDKRGGDQWRIDAPVETTPRDRNDPYAVMEVKGVGWKLADAFAQHVGIASDDPRQLRAATKHVLANGHRENQTSIQGENDGHTWMHMNELLEATGRMLGVSPLKVQDALLNGTTHVVIDTDGRAYRVEMLRAERNLANGINRLRFSRSYLSIENIDFDTVFANAPFSPTLEQQEAVRHLLMNKVSILTGGPGTGKSSIVRIVLDALEQLSVKGIYLAAPTGKAAKRLSETSGYSATTIHRLVSRLQDTNDASTPEVVIIDETSMLDTLLAEQLIGELPSECHLILVGDDKQLPSIGAGRVLHDLIHAGIPTAQLTRVMRNSGGILEAVYAMHNGNVLPAGQYYPDYHVFETASPEQVVECVIWLVTQGIPQMYGIPPMKFRCWPHNAHGTVLAAE